MRVTSETKIATERALRTAARKLFVRHGLDATNTRQIAEAAKVAAGTLFNYFPSKEALAMSIVAEALRGGRDEALGRLEAARGGTAGTLEEDLFTLVAGDVRALEPIRSFAAEALESGLSPFASGSLSVEAAEIRSLRLEDVGRLLERHGLGGSANSAVLHLYWALYLGVLSFWSADRSPKQEDTWAVLDQSIHMFAGSLRPAAERSAPVASGRRAARPAKGERP